jgi:hypothetical protein
MLLCMARVLHELLLQDDRLVVLYEKCSVPTKYLQFLPRCREVVKVAAAQCSHSEYWLQYAEQICSMIGTMCSGEFTREVCA